jgi:hypothetical protein
MKSTESRVTPGNGLVHADLCGSEVGILRGKDLEEGMEHRRGGLLKSWNGPVMEVQVSDDQIEIPPEETKGHIPIPYLTLEDLAVEDGVFPANEIQTHRRHPLICTLRRRCTLSDIQVAPLGSPVPLYPMPT